MYNKSIKILISLLLLTNFSFNLSLSAQETTPVNKNDNKNIKIKNLETVELNLEKTEIQTDEDLQAKLKIESEKFFIDQASLDKAINNPSLKDIKTNQEKEATQERLSKATSLLLLGGMSVSRSIEKSLAGSTADHRLRDNFASPLKSIKDGNRADDNEFLINYVGHPMEWFIIANYLKASGASDKEAIIISQLTNIAWEYIIEGSYIAPSPKDLASNTLGSLAGIYFYNKVLNKPMNSTYAKIADFGEKHNVDIVPEVKYNSMSKGLRIGTRFKIKR